MGRGPAVSHSVEKRWSQEALVGYCPLTYEMHIPVFCERQMRRKSDITVNAVWMKTVCTEDWRFGV
eukprot:COSAG02_NODE_679_length_18565_cov_57.795245_21_plen_66_part_00